MSPQIFKSLRHSIIHNVVNIFKFASSCYLIASFAVLCDLERGRKNDSSQVLMALFNFA